MKTATSLTIRTSKKSGFSFKKHPDTDLLELHKSLLTKKLNTLPIKLRTKKQILKLYDATISSKNIRKYYNAHIDNFLKALVTNQLHLVEKYV